MSERTKKHHINTDKGFEEFVLINNRKRTRQFLRVPQVKLPKFNILIEPYDFSGDRELSRDSVSADEVFGHLDKKYGKVGATIRGLRLRDDLTQVELANKLGIQQTHISEMENSKRPVGKAMAHRLAEIFNINYRLFL